MLNKYSRILTNDITKGATRSMLYGLKFTDDDFTKGLISIGSVTFDGNPCNVHTGILADHIKTSINKSNHMKGLRFTMPGVSDGITIGLPNLATINKSSLSLYNPIVVTYGWDEADVSNPLTTPFE